MVDFQLNDKRCVEADRCKPVDRQAGNEHSWINRADRPVWLRQIDRVGYKVEAT